jgi:uncharacterized protein YndB with AHSA1/START domain
MADVETSITIQRPVEEVFQHWADGRLYNQWQPAATKKDVRLVTPEPIGVGSRFRGTFKGAGAVEYTILGYEPPRLLAMTTTTPMGELRHTITCAPAGGGTRVVQTGEAHLRGIYRLLKPLLMAVFRRSFRANDAALRDYLEGARRPATHPERGTA